MNIFDYWLSCLDVGIVPIESDLSEALTDWCDSADSFYYCCRDVVELEGLPRGATIPADYLLTGRQLIGAFLELATGAQCATLNGHLLDDAMLAKLCPVVHPTVWVWVYGTHTSDWEGADKERAIATANTWRNGQMHLPERTGQ